jgi:hypothetical protein
MNKVEIINNMCMTYRHDYGITRNETDPPWVAGMTPNEREGLYKTMEQIFDNDIAPLLKNAQDLYDGNAVVVPKDKEHAEALVKMGMFYLGQQNDPK